MGQEKLSVDFDRIRTPPQLFESIRDGSVFQGSTRIEWREASCVFDAGIGAVRDELKSPGALADEWGYAMSPAQVALLRDADSGELGRGVVVIFDNGVIVELEHWPLR